MEIKIELKDEQVRQLLVGITQKLNDLTPCMRQIAGIMHHAVEENFAQQGRPKWKPSMRVAKEGGVTLQKSGRLAASITSQATGNQAAVGTNVIYAAIQQFGGRTAAHIIRPKTAKALFWLGAKHPVKLVHHPGSDIPARPFLSLTEEDWIEIRKKMAEYLLKT